MRLSHNGYISVLNRVMVIVMAVDFVFDTDFILSTTSLERQRMNFKVGIAKSRLEFTCDCRRGIRYGIGRGIGRIIGRRLGAVILGCG